MEKSEITLLLVNGHILTMDEQGTQYLDGYVAVSGTDIAAVGPMDQCPALDGLNVIDCRGCIIIPGLINCHTHLPMVYFRGMADDLPLMDWLNNHIWPAERKHLSPEFCYEATVYAAAECIKNGITCVNDMYIFAADIGRALADTGLRGYVSEGVLDPPTAAAANAQEGKRLTEELISRFTGHELVTPVVSVHAPYTCSPETLRMMHAVAQEHRLLYHIHLHETENEPEHIDWGRNDESPLHAIKRIGVLGPRMIAAHCVWISDHDIHHMHEFDCGVAHCPSSNMKLGSGIAPVHSMIEGNLAVGLGTDGAASNNNLNMIEEVHLAALGAKAVYKNPEVIPAQLALSFATSRAAKLLHNDRIGVLEAGRHADIAVVRTDGLHATPRYNTDTAVYSHLAYSAQSADIRDTIINGRVLMRNRTLTTLDEAQLKAKAQEWVDRNF